MTLPEVVRLITSGMHAVPVDPQLTVFTGPNVNGTFSDGGVKVGGVVEESPIAVEEYESGHAVNGGMMVQFVAVGPSMKVVPQNVVPGANRPDELKHSCPPQRAEVEDRSTCTFCARAGAARNKRATTTAATGRKNMDKGLLLVVIPVSSHFARSCKSRIA